MQKWTDLDSRPFTPAMLLLYTDHLRDLEEILLHAMFVEERCWSLSVFVRAESLLSRFFEVCRFLQTLKRSQGLFACWEIDWGGYLMTIEPCHEIMVLFVLYKLILQTHMLSCPVGLDVRFLVGAFVNFHTSCVRTAKALARLRSAQAHRSLRWSPMW